MTDLEAEALKYFEDMGYAKKLPDGNWDFKFIIALADVAKKIDICSTNLDERNQRANPN